MEATFAQVVEMVRDLTNKVEAHTKKEDEDRQLLESIKMQVSDLTRGFPEGDPERHRIVHEAMIQSAKEERDFWLSMKKGVALWSLIFFLGLVGGGLWYAVTRGWRG